MTIPPIFDRVRKLCLSFPETSERLAHGSPSFYVREKRNFLVFSVNHHDDGNIAFWCAAPPGDQAALVEADPDTYFVPPYVGHRGWVGVRVDQGAPWEEIAKVVTDAYRVRAPRTVRTSAGIDI
ncbi:MAG TPA: MmcQ/YjbR family DNA-binding protein [Candidatus Dormibacteraeota bacterium]